MTQFNISTTQLQSSFLVSLNIVLKTLQYKMKATHHDFIAIFKGCGCLENWILLQHCLLHCPFMHALVSIFIKHCLCNPHSFYQSDSSVSAAFILSSLLVELCVCLLELLFTYHCKANLGRYAIFQFMVQLYTGCFTKMLKNVERQGGRAKTLIKPWNFEDQIDILSVGIVKFQYS